MIIDAFILNNELDVLEIRLGTLYEKVDAFVIVESLGYHGSERKKPQANLRHFWKEFERWGDKIDYTIVQDLQPPWTSRDDSWPRENYHRNLLKAPIMRLSQRADDIIMISDADEIPRPEMIPTDLRGSIALGQDFFYYNVNTFKGEWHGTVVTTRGQLEQNDVQYFRNRRDNLPVIKNGGWHLSYFGGIEHIRHKVSNFAHAKDDICHLIQYRTDEELKDSIRNRRDIYNRPNEPVADERTSDDPRLPKYYLENIGRFQHFTKDGMGL